MKKKPIESNPIELNEDFEKFLNGGSSSESSSSDEEKSSENNSIESENLKKFEKVYRASQKNPSKPSLVGLEEFKRRENQMLGEIVRNILKIYGLEEALAVAEQIRREVPKSPAVFGSTWEEPMYLSEFVDSDIFKQHIQPFQFSQPMKFRKLMHSYFDQWHYQQMKLDIPYHSFLLSLFENNLDQFESLFGELIQISKPQNDNDDQELIEKLMNEKKTSSFGDSFNLQDLIDSISSFFPFSVNFEEIANSMWNQYPAFHQNPPSEEFSAGTTEKLVKSTIIMMVFAQLAQQTIEEEQLESFVQLERQQKRVEYIEQLLQEMRDQSNRDTLYYSTLNQIDYEEPIPEVLDKVYDVTINEKDFDIPIFKNPETFDEKLKERQELFEIPAPIQFDVPIENKQEKDYLEQLRKAQRKKLILKRQNREGEEEFSFPEEHKEFFSQQKIAFEQKFPSQKYETSEQSIADEVDLRTRLQYEEVIEMMKEKAAKRSFKPFEECTWDDIFPLQELYVMEAFKLQLMVMAHDSTNEMIQSMIKNFRSVTKKMDQEFETEIEKIEPPSFSKIMGEENDWEQIKSLAEKKLKTSIEIQVEYEPIPKFQPFYKSRRCISKPRGLSEMAAEINYLMQGAEAISNEAKKDSESNQEYWQSVMDSFLDDFEPEKPTNFDDIPDFNLIFWRRKAVRWLKRQNKPIPAYLDPSYAYGLNYAHNPSVPLSKRKQREISQHKKFSSVLNSFFHDPDLFLRFDEP